jgi:hypothetical protein
VVVSIKLERINIRETLNTYVDAALMAAGKTVAKSAKRTPRGESSRQRPGKSLMEGIFPIQRPFIQPTPVVTLTFSSSDQVAIYIKKRKNDGQSR